MPSVRREIAEMETSVKYASTMLSHLEQNVKPIVLDGQTICACAVFGHVAEKLACLALSTWAYGAVVTFWFFFPVTQSAYVLRTQMAGW
jgi:hypothetical protein